MRSAIVYITLHELPELSDQVEVVNVLLWTLNQTSNGKEFMLKVVYIQ